MHSRTINGSEMRCRRRYGQCPYADVCSCLGGRYINTLDDWYSAAYSFARADCRVTCIPKRVRPGYRGIASCVH